MVKTTAVWEGGAFALERTFFYSRVSDKSKQNDLSFDSDETISSYSNP